MQPRDVTIVVPTYNRPQELTRLMVFLAHCQNPYPIHVLDGSNEQNQAANLAICNQYLNVRHRGYDSKLHVGLRCHDGFRQIDTQFCLLCPDDDLVFPDGITRAAQFLRSNPDYGSAVGWFKTMIARPNGWRRRGFLLGNELEHGRDINHPDFGYRLRDYFAYTWIGFIPLYYALRHTSEMTETFSMVTARMKYTSVELLSVALALLAGKLKVLPVVFGIRNYSSEAIRNPEREDANDYYGAEDLEYMRSILLPQMVGKHGIDETIAKYILDVEMMTCKHSLERPQQTPAGRKIQTWMENLHYAGSILRPDLVADHLSIDRATYRALKIAQAASLAYADEMQQK